MLLRDADLGYGRTRVLSRLSVSIPAGAFVGIVGPSGSGKTTLLRSLLGEATIQGGEVRVGGQLVRRGRPARLGYVPQVDRVDWDFPATVEQVVLLGLAGRSARRPWFSRAERRTAHRLLDRLGLGGLQRRPIGVLSGGQRQRMFLARALVHDTDLLLLDEPTSGVDLQTRQEILQLLGELNAEGVTVVLTTHDLNWVAAHLPRIVCLNGVVTGDGPPAEVLTPSVLHATYGADVEVIRHGDLVVVADRARLLDPGSGGIGEPGIVVGEQG